MIFWTRVCMGGLEEVDIEDLIIKMRRGGGGAGV